MDGLRARMTALTDLAYWLGRWYEDDTVHALRLLALVGSDYPELAELAGCLDRVEVLTGVHRQRLEGADIVQLGDEYLCLPLPAL